MFMSSTLKFDISFRLTFATNSRYFMSPLLSEHLQMEDSSDFHTYFKNNVNNNPSSKTTISSESLGLDQDDESTTRSDKTFLENLELRKRLFEEFDSLGLCSEGSSYSETDLCVYAFSLVNSYRKLLSQLKEVNYACTALRGDKQRLEKHIDSLKRGLNEQNNTIVDLKKKLMLTTMRCEDLEKEREALQQEQGLAKNHLKYHSSEWEHKIRQLEAENQKLRNMYEKGIGSHTSRDEITVSVLHKYKENEEQYKETIQKLQEHNQGLISQLLDLLTPAYAS